MKSWLQDNDTGMYSTHNEEKSVVTERFIRTLRNKIHTCMTSISNNVYTRSKNTYTRSKSKINQIN